VLLAIDVGNTQTHLGMFRDDELVEHWRFATVRFATADELATVIASLLDLRDLRLLGDVDAAIVSSVVPTLAHEYEQLLARYLDGNGALVGPSLKTGMPIRIDTPQELGADRLVNAVAAYDRIGAACIAVDFGTAINYDVVSSAGEYLGGVISPGIEISLEALAARAARLPRVDIEKPRHVIGKGTQEAIQSGVVYGFAGQVDAILCRLREELGEEATAIATGGFAAAIVPFCEHVDDVDDLLTLTGLKLIWDRNRDS
jgi:type III pantothenate kinase